MVNRLEANAPASDFWSKWRLVRLDGDEGLFRAYESVEFLAPLHAGDFIEVEGEIVSTGKTSRKMRFEARKVISPRPDVSDSAAEVLELLNRHEKVSMFAAPTMVKRMVDEGRQASGLQTLVYGGGPMYLADLHAAMDVLGDKKFEAGDILPLGPWDVRVLSEPAQ